MKPKENKGYNTGTYDECQTPPYALEPLIPYIEDLKFPVWECANGKGVLERCLKKNKIQTIGTDLSTGHDFFEYTPGYSCIVTNPPYSIKYDWLIRCYELRYPFALLLPVETIGTAKAQHLFGLYEVEIIFMSPRVDFYMPNKGWKGGGAQFPTAWFTWKLNLPQQINFATLNKPKRSELEEYWNKALGLKVFA